MTAEEVAFIGDVHGCASTLASLLARVVPRVDRIVMLGDYVNRGPRSREVLDILHELQTSEIVALTLLRGNHDAIFRAVIDDSTRENEFLRMGGAATIRSYIAPPYNDVFARLREAVPPEHIAILDSLDERWKSSTVLATHDWNGLLDERDAVYVVAGHSVQSGLQPSVGEHSAFIDTGCGTTLDGPLTAFFWPSRDWIQEPAILA